ncbi:hypothetical protein NEOLEDRAFT_1060271 [Neolentinus lepideus HHB14362 ss-1]|uniref:CAP-Gly domain-containing protein n=1 Tax=Neolentinus lepideus HHB14362 ss-1 TaxID=1314782 RepID=A0A165U166_9AGAM|nr:hypothetical protein NEOLEDRAFT_1060271 [Neolentinus lepideus HHB14362 ss-1]
MASMEPTVGALVEVTVGRGTVRFNGTTSFAPGKWVGIELYEPKGKNNGSVQGVSYFNCKPNHGVFVRPSQVTVIPAKPERPAPPVCLKTSRKQTAARPSLSHQRTSSTASARAGPSSAGVSPRSSSPLKPSTKVSPAPSAQGSSTTPRLGSPTKRLSLVQTGGLQSRKSLARTVSHESNPAFSPTVASPRQTESPGPLPQVKRSKRASSPPLPQVTASLRSVSPPPPPSAFAREPSPILSTSPLKPPSRPPSSLSLLPQHSQDEQELQELRAKVRVLEAKRADDARHVRELEMRLSEAESFVALRPKLQAKLNQLQTELTASRRELADSKQISDLSETKILDAQEQLEMAMLDKEMAEERAESAETELEELKERLAIAEVELKVVKEGGAVEDGDAPDNIKSSLAYIQLEKQNERLKEALFRLREISQETDLDQRRRIQEMEKDVGTLDELQTQYEETLIKLSNAEVQIEDLKMQLDDALGAEDLLVQLTERNLMLSEKIEEMRITIEDLEALKELNDELEENHMETEKTLQEEIDVKDSELRERRRKIESLEDACVDMENTISQFRELVMNLQHDLDTLRAENQSAQQESATAASQTAAMMSLNLKLQSSASKQQAKTIESELRGYEAREARELLSIVQPYLPQIYLESDSDATSCYLLFQRLAFKTDLINMIVGQAHGLPDSLNGPVADVLVGICEMRGRIASLSNLCKRFAAVLRRCDAESFLNIGRLYLELAPMEKRIDVHIDLLRRDEFREMECVSDVIKLQAQFDHLAETYFANFDHDLGERELGYASAFDLDLDMVAASMGLAKTSVAAIMKDTDAALDLGGYDIENEFFAPLQKVLDQCKGAKSLSRKLIKRLEELIMDSLALKVSLIPQLQALNNKVSELVNFGIQLAQQIMPHLSDARGEKEAFQLTKVLSFVKQVTSSTVGKDRKDGVTSWEAVGEYIAGLVNEAAALVPLAMEGVNVTKITGNAPWVVRVKEIKANTAVNIEAERKVAQLSDEIQGLYRSLKSKDQSIQEAGVKIELMERRMETVKKHADTIAELESELAKARKQERAYEEAMEQLQADLDALEQDNAKLKTMTVGPQREPSTAQPVEVESIAVEGSLETSYLLEQLEALRGTVRFLRMENSYLKSQDLLREIQTLPPLPEPISREPTPPLEPSGLSDTDSESEELSSPPTLRSLTTETKVLYRDVIRFSSTPRVVDLSELNANRVEGKTKSWMPRNKNPAHQVYERKMEAERLSRRVKGLLDRANAIAGAR